MPRAVDHCDVEHRWSVAVAVDCVCVVELLCEMSCPTCQQIICADTPDTELYSIQRPLFPFVFFCLPGQDCSNADSFKMVCCGELLSVTFPPGFSEENKAIARNLILNECEANLAICSGDNNPGCQAPPCEPPPPIILFYNREVACDILCPDGTTFTFTVLAGTFADFTQADADNQAHLYACQQVALRRVCISSFARCLCVGSAFSSTITATGGIGPIRFTIFSGALPDGLTMTLAGVISGTPTASGVFHFSIKATTLDGGYNVKPFTLSVLEIVTSSITGYTIGTPYSFQMLGAGGSGNYQWSIASGTLPTGLTISDSGLISGTPTADGTNPVEFRLIDLQCEAAVATVYPPRITMATQSTTQIATVRGYDEFVPSIPPKRYHTATWSGSAEQKLFVAGVQIGGAKYDYFGFDHINARGFIDSTHSKVYSAQCDTPLPIYGQILGNNIFGVGGFYPFKGYYGMAVSVPGLLGNPEFLCPTSNIPYATIGDIGINGTFDQSDLWGAGLVNGTVNVGRSLFLAQDAVTKSDATTGSNDVLVTPYNPIINVGFNITNIPRDFYTVGRVDYINNYSCILSDEYTDAEALTNARVISGNSNAAQNFPRTTGFVSTFTNVVFTLLSTVLVPGNSYQVQVDFFDLTNGTHSTRAYGFDADNTGQHTITDVIPTPLPGHTIQVRNPRIAIVP